MTGTATNHDEVETRGTSPIAKFFAMRRRRPRLGVDCEVDTKARPFKASVMEPFIDLNNCTYAVMSERSRANVMLNKFGTKLFTNCAYSMLRNCGGGNCSDSDSSDSEEEEEKKEKKNKKFSTRLTLSLGVHEGEWKGERVFLLKQQQGKPKGTRCGVDALHTSVLFAEGRGRGEFLQELVEHFIQLGNTPPKPQHFKIYRWSHNDSYWRHTSEERARLMQSVILPEGLREGVEADMERFLSDKTKHWYQKYGIPYKRSYMFWGVPGTGKTSLITALAGRFQRKVCFLSSHHPRFTDEMFKEALSEVPKKAIVVLEDIDSLFDKDRKTNNSQSPLTFTGLLNGLDGIGEHTGSIFVMTTNFIERLDKALIRAGRVDMKVEFKHANDYQLEGMFKWFYGDFPKDAEKFAVEFRKNVREACPNRGVTMAELQQHFVDCMNDDAETCCGKVGQYIKEVEWITMTLEKAEKEAKEAQAKAEAEEARQKAEALEQEAKEARGKSKELDAAEEAAKEDPSSSKESSPGTEPPAKEEVLSADTTSSYPYRSSILQQVPTGALPLA